tara:strand:- start:3215 stop:3886 length:672 start_codon:yes stop_codon:yes gene_type:complete
MPERLRDQTPEPSVLLYDGRGPNPRVVRMFLHEKGLHLPMEQIDIVRGDNRSETFVSINPFATIPALRLDDGTILSDSVAICRFMEDTFTDPDLMGRDAAERAEITAWIRHIDASIVFPMTLGFRAAEGRTMFNGRVPLPPEGVGSDLKRIAAAELVAMNARLSSRSYVCGERFTLADIVLFAFVRFGASVGQPAPAGLSALEDWTARMAARPSAAASEAPGQ